MRQRALTLLAVLGVALAATGLLFAGAANAAGHSATRSIDPTSVEAGGQVDVTIAATGLGGFGQVIETLPAGFRFVSADSNVDRHSAVGQEVRFTIFAVDATFTYKVEVDASTQPGDYSISGVARDSDYQTNQDNHTIGGHASVTVTAAATSPTPEPTEEVTPEPGTPSATRSFSSSTVEAGASLDVTVASNDYGVFGRIVETLPAGFSYDSVSPADTRVSQSGQTVSFNLLGADQSITYTVTAGDTVGAQAFSGVLKDEDNADYDIGGASSVTVEAVAGPRASRSFSPSSVTPGGTLRVRVSARDYGVLGRIMETMPAGFDYVSVSPADTRVSQSGQTLTFTFVGGNQTFTYTVTAPDTEGSYSFSGSLEDEDQISYPVGGASEVPVAVAPPSAIRSLSESTVTAGDDIDVTIIALNYGRFGRVAESLPAGFTYKSVTPPDTRVAVSGRSVTFTVVGGNQVIRYTVEASETSGRYVFSGILFNEDNAPTQIVGANTVTVRSARPPSIPPGPYVGPDTPTPEPTATAVPPTATAVPPTATAVPPTATAVPPTATSVPPTATSVPPTATAVPPAPTATSVPPTATAVPPTATATSVPPTATSVPPTATSVPPTATAVPPTATSVPPTATAVPPAPTATSVPPTATSVPPTATSVPPTATSVPPTATSVPPAPTATSVPPTVAPAPTPVPTVTPAPVEEERRRIPGLGDHPDHPRSDRGSSRSSRIRPPAHDGPATTSLGPNT